MLTMMLMVMLIVMLIVILLMGILQSIRIIMIIISAYACRAVSLEGYGRQQDLTAAFDRGKGKERAREGCVGTETKKARGVSLFHTLRSLMVVVVVCSMLLSTARAYFLAVAVAVVAAPVPVVAFLSFLSSFLKGRNSRPPM